MKQSQNISLIYCRIPDFDTAMCLVSGTPKSAKPLKSINAYFDYSSLQMLKDNAKNRLRQLDEEQILFNFRKANRKTTFQKFIDFLKHKL